VGVEHQAQQVGSGALGTYDEDGVHCHISTPYRGHQRLPE
jgi:hypothetical protein